MKVTIAGKAMVFTSGIKLEDLQKIAKYKPEALSMALNEEKTKFFSAAVKKTGVVSNAGIFFDSADADGYACATLVAECDPPTKEFVNENFGTAIFRMNQLEAQLPAVIEEIAAQDAAVDACIQQL